MMVQYILDLGDRHLYAVNPNGTLKWRFDTGGATESSLAISQDGNIYVGSYNGKIFCINPDGTEKWRFETNDGVLASPAIDKNGIIYIGSNDRNFYALNPDGSLKWKYNTGSDILSSPAIADDGTIYFGTRSYLYALETIDNYPPNKSSINGPTSGKQFRSYEYIISTSDQDGDNIYYYIDWGDDTNSGWKGPYNNTSEQITLSHSWLTTGTYSIRAKAKDVFDAESDWATLEVSMPKNKVLMSPLYQLLEWFPMLQYLWGKLIT